MALPSPPSRAVSALGEWGCCWNCSPVPGLKDEFGLARMNRGLKADRKWVLWTLQRGRKPCSSPLGTSLVVGRGTSACLSQGFCDLICKRRVPVPRPPGWGFPAWDSNNSNPETRSERWHTQQFHSHFLGLTTSLHVPSPGRGRKGILFAEESVPGTALRAFTWWSHLILTAPSPTPHLTER